MSLNFSFSVLALLLCVSVASVAYAQVPLPESANPGRFENRFKKRLYSDEANIVAPPEFQSIPIPEVTEGFVLKGVILDGVTVFNQATLENITGKYINKTVDLNVLNHLAGRITQLYRSAGYFLSKAVINPQEVEGGIVEIQVIEAYVDEVVFDDPSGLLIGDYFNISEKIRNRIKALKPLHGPSFERYILLLNDGVGVSVQSILKASPDLENPGAVYVTLRVKKRSSISVFGYNNYGSRYIGPHQIDLGYSIGRLLSPYDVLNIQGTMSIPVREVQFGRFSYNLPLNESGLRLGVSASYSNSEPGLELQNLEVEGDSFSLEMGLTYPVIRSRRTNFNIGTNLKLSNNAVEFLDQELLDDKLRVLSFTADLQTLDNWKGANEVFFSVAKGLDIFNATETGSPRLSRAQGRSDFIKIEVNVSRFQNIYKNLGVLTTLQGQYAPHPLLSSQEFGFGGAKMGRAYNASEITGDQGVAGSVEFSYSGLPSFKYLPNFVPFAFYEVGKVWNEDTGSKPISAASAGIGTTYNFKNAPLYGSLQVALPLTKPVNSPVMGGDDGPRFLFDLKLSF